MSDLDDLLDMTLDDLEDLPAFKPFPVGVCRAKATFEEKEINGKKSVDLGFVFMEAVEQADPEEAPAKEGDKCNTAFMLDNEYGRGNLKKCAGYFQAAFPELKTIRDVINTIKDVEVLLVSGVKADKDDKDKKYLVVKEIAVV